MLISIIIPAYNVEDYIEECIHSAYAQKHKEIEVICIDNNSKDQTWQKLKQLKKQYPQLILEIEIKPGAPVARNKGLKLSKGQWIQFLDADDLLKPEKLEHQVSIINNSPGVDVPFIATACIKQDLKGDETIHNINREHPFKGLFATQLGNTCANLWNRHYIEKINGWDESLKSSQEADLMFRLLQLKDQVIVDNEPLTIVRERPEGQISQRGELTRLNDYFYLRWRIYQWLRNDKRDLFEKHHSFFNSKILFIIQLIAKENLNHADQLFKAHLKKTLNVKEIISKKYPIDFFLYWTIGFKIIESFKFITKKLYK